MRNNPGPQEIYKHFKGTVYRIVTLAQHSETGEELVIYQALYGDNKVYARSLEQFMSKTDKKKYPEATQEYRFEQQSGVLIASTEETAEKAENKPLTERNQKADQENGQVDAICDDLNSENFNSEDFNPEDFNPEDFNPLIMEFLDAETYRDRLNVLTSMHHKLTDDLIDIIAASLETEVKAGDIEKRYAELRNYLITLEKYECSRLR